MRRRGTLNPVLAVVALSIAIAQPALCQDAQPAKAPVVKPIAAMDWLIGGVWTADVSPPGGAPVQIETRYLRSDNSAFVRFTTHFVSDKGTLKNYDGNFFWNADQSALAMWYTDASGGIIQGPVTIHADTMSMTFRATDFDGKMADLRATVVRKNIDTYSWQLEEKQPGPWKPLLSLEYRRTYPPTFLPTSAR
jgi:hypothetical protein